MVFPEITAFIIVSYLTLTRSLLLGMAQGLAHAEGPFPTRALCLIFFNLTRHSSVLLPVSDLYMYLPLS